ncbi:hypothetical protein GLOTRDRAFT_32948 [Gloeophyllum trabeum ATCC 11539]|uniref:Paired domain-containing protein n=1 Tax=Gloeophyllum trabeum (strain ATCC 11539 / FP-39264 / Madison 617) TaxID=670483 RepID=S7QJG4_GLOTA|nr:uncharacterized protein GLOTRDRAFT_32948 [Gloeophyllum trabeum ATCC 11539]EPQ59468.1 hypothetical protein GLOTRDRAFT_32948 [Gloeophyllum trabeum ATCC 11539]
MVHLTRQLRERIIVWRHEQNKTLRVISELAGCSISTIFEVLRLYTEYGTVINPNARPRGRPRTLDMQDMNFVRSVIEGEPAIYLDELRDRVYNRLHSTCSLSA